MFGNMEEQQKKMAQKMQEIKVNHHSQDGEINLTFNGGMELENILIDFSKLDLESSDQLEDLLIVTINEALLRVQTIQAAESQKMLAQMMPGGMGDLGKLFGA